MTTRFLLTFLLVLGIAGCSHSPTAKSVEPEAEGGVRTGKVHNIVITDRINPETLTVRAGDQVRWLNQRQSEVTIALNEPLEGKVSCRNGFSKALSMGVDNSTTLDANESAALCFNRLGTVHYSVRTDSTDDSRPLRETEGTITVE